MEIITAVIEKYGISAAVVVFLGEKIFTWATGSYWKWKKAIEANTAAINGLRGEWETISKDIKRVPKMGEDLRVAFHNLKEVRTRLKMGDLTIPSKTLDQ